MWIGVAAVVLWLLSAVSPIMQINRYILPFLPFVAGPIIRFTGEAESKKWKIKFEWNWKDWLGLCLFIAVVYAVFSGTDPIELLQELKDIIT